MSKRRFAVHSKAYAVLSLLLLLSLFTPFTAALAEPSFNNDLFKAKWQRADKPIVDGVANPQRSWLWGPESFNPANGTTEAYAESPGGARTVLYFDKARMEMNNPATGTVTNGLLVRELISGKLATGDSAFTQRKPADDIPIAGDPGGNVGPTYSSFGKVATTNNDNPSTDRTGQVVADTIGKDGAVGNNPALGGYTKYIYFDTTLKHNIPQVFWDFLNQKGNVYINGKLENNQPVLGDNPYAPWLDATGFPITEAYWATVTVAGQQKMVLTQAYERRVLTYTPDNPEAYKVEMGNVGRHYFTWRYDVKYDAPAVTPTPTPPTGPTGCASLPANKGKASPVLPCGPAGMVMGAIAREMGSGEMVQIAVKVGKITYVDVDVAQSDGVLVYFWNSMPNEEGLWTINFKGLTSGIEEETYIWAEPKVTKPTIIVFPNPGKLDQDITTVLAGFEYGEQVNILFTPPDPRGALIAHTKIARGGGSTGFWVLREIYKGYEQFLQPGNWTIIASSSNGQRSASASITMTK